MKYWPEETYTYQKIKVTLISDLLFPNCVERIFEIQYTGSQSVSTVKQYHFTNWRGPVPDQAGFIDFIYYMRFLTKDTLEPLLLHSP